MVASPNFRHPVPFARELLALDDISGGRLVVGIGAGGVGWDATTLGNEPWSPAERAGRFEEFVELLDRLLREILVHDFFYATAALPRSVKWPVDFVVTALRTLKMKLASTRFTKTISINGADKLVSITRAHLLNDTANSDSISSLLPRNVPSACG